MKEKLLDWFCKKGVNKKDIVKKAKDNYMELGYIDSLGFLELISYCEDTFKISFEDEDFEDDAIFTIEGLINIIKKRTK